MIARQHLDIGEQMMAERHRLRRLEMGEARHHHVGAFERARRQRLLQLGDLAVERVDRVAHPQLEVDARPGRCASARCAAGPAAGPIELGEPALDVHVNVLERAREDEGPRLDFALDLVQAGGDGVGVGLRDDALGGEHGDMGERAGDVLGGELAVEVDGGVDLLDDLGGAAGETPAPHGVAHLKRPLERWTRTRRGPVDGGFWAAPGALAAVAAVAVLYGIGAPGGKAAAGLCPAAAAARAAALAPLAHGDIAALAVDTRAASSRPTIAFDGPGGAKLQPRRFPRQGAAAEPLGDLVRALPRRDAGARPIFLDPISNPSFLS